ncbi:hypothetical protein FEM03_09670 [Phragmitibacter flavus]|uniref:Uncharacterized protein n=1 Tax=Phragmitibacter flavus TaxID=2576071 RepID=A0A5R8KGS3_9BACT|nr:hypothetical protein [Phragmitibacter flavus]TLD71165.1 hypothetical protein FEM03_09670 [Phragmitibacter flavus]
MNDQQIDRLATSITFGVKNALNAFFILPLIALGIYFLHTAQQFSKPADQSPFEVSAIIYLSGALWCSILLYQRRKLHRGIFSELLLILFLSSAFYHWLQPAENQPQQNIRIAYLLITIGLLLGVLREWWQHGKAKETPTQGGPP